ncbi:hypothetical protein [Oceanobacillus sp. CFH 90083]|uniref:hypothetical protein n=1 Tax=Oceanobacillus sp. CFH 90083 TaxID=2592336 RepID=UPI0018841D64|nr:hypothetical protein [Oceanobacillus sp. CFH 90083]
MKVYILYEHDLLVSAWTPTVHSIFLKELAAKKEMERLNTKGEYRYSVTEKSVIK